LIGKIGTGGIDTLDIDSKSLAFDLLNEESQVTSFIMNSAPFIMFNLVSTISPKDTTFLTSHISMPKWLILDHPISMPKWLILDHPISMPSWKILGYPINGLEALLLITITITIIITILCCKIEKFNFLTIFSMDLKLMPIQPFKEPKYRVLHPVGPQWGGVEDNATKLYPPEIKRPIVEPWAKASGPPTTGDIKFRFDNKPKK